MILIYTKEVHLSFDGNSNPLFKGKKHGNLYLTSHRIIFINTTGNDPLRSFSMPFHSMKNVQLQQPIFGANYLSGSAFGQTNGGFTGEVQWKLTFNKGGCIDFGQALLKANDMGMQQIMFKHFPADKPRRRNCPVCCCFPLCIWVF
jgi:hypothetical protein